MSDRSNKTHKRVQSKPASGHAVDLAHDLGGAIIFAFPLLMTMEMWWLGFYMDRSRLALFLALALVVVIAFYGLPDLCVVALVAYDTIKQRRLHPAYLWGGLLLIASHPLRIMFAGTDTWLGIADSLVSLVR